MAVDTTPIQAIYNKLNQVAAFHPGSTEIFDDFLQEAGDIVTLMSGSASYEFPIFSQHMTWNGSMLTTMKSTGNKTRNALPPLQRKQKNSSYSTGRRATQQQEELTGYHTDIIKTEKTVGMQARAIGVKLGPDGNPLVDENGDFIWDDESTAEIYSRLMLAPNRTQLVTALNQNGVLIRGSSIDLTTEGATIATTLNNTSGVQISGSKIDLTTEGATIATTLNNTAGVQLSGAKVDLSNQGTVLIQAINNRPGGQSSVTIEADKIDLTGYVTASSISAQIGVIDDLTSQTGYIGTIRASAVHASGNIVADGAMIATGLYFGDSAPYTNVGNAVASFGTPTSSGGQITIPWTKLDGTAGTSINFNIADTAYYQSHVGIQSTGSWTWDGDLSTYVREITPNDGDPQSIVLPVIVVYSNIPSNPAAGFTAVARLSGQTNDVSLAKSYYLQAVNDYVYVTTNNSAPSVGTNVVARLQVQTGGTAGISSVALTNSSNQVADWNAWRSNFASYDSLSSKYAYIVGTAANGDTYNFGINATGVFEAGQAEAGVSINATNKTVDRSLSSATKSVAISAVASIAYDSTTHKYTAYATAKAANTEMDSDDVDSGTQAYEAGWGSAYGKVTLPGAMTVTTNALVTVKTPPSTVDGSAVTTNLYLVCADDYIYVRSVNSTSGGTTYAKIANTKQSQDAGIASVAIFNHSDAVADWNSWRPNFDSFESLSDRYAYIRATANDGTIYKYGINAEGVYTAGYNAAPVGLLHTTDLLTWSASSNDESVYNGWSYVDAISTGGYKYRQYYVTAANGDTAYIKVNASSTYTAGYNAAPVGIPNDCVVHVGYSNDASDYSDWSTVDTLSMSSYKYKLIKVVANDGTEKYVKIHADGTYTAGLNAVTATFTHVNSLPSGQTATNLVNGYLYNFKVVKDGTTTTSVYYKVPASSSYSSADIDLQVLNPVTSLPSASGYTARVQMSKLIGLIDLYKNSSTLRYIPIEATAPGCSGKKLYYLTVGGSSD